MTRGTISVGCVCAGSARPVTAQRTAVELTAAARASTHKHGQICTVRANTWKSTVQTVLANARAVYALACAVVVLSQRTSAISHHSSVVIAVRTATGITAYAYP